MQIITIDDKEFNQLLEAWRTGKLIGQYNRNGKTQIVMATKQFMLVSSANDPKKIALQPARNLSDAEQLAVDLLLKEEERGNEITLEPRHAN